ncbi:MAG TPA: alpha/beta family hydrolase, partial [Gaiella sp.]|nr:alpha/beta family hydrolase [Gaiella sp.]
QLDTAWRAVVQALCENETRGLPLVVGGRSSGARVACRTAGDVGAAGVLCLAFPLVPPARRSGVQPVSRLPELDAVGVPVLVVQGANDRFGIPPAAPRRTVVVVPGDHALRSGLGELRAAVGAWLGEVV